MSNMTQTPAATDSLQSILISLAKLQEMDGLDAIARELAEVDDTLGSLVDDMREGGA